MPDFVFVLTFRDLLAAAGFIGIALFWAVLFGTLALDSRRRNRAVKKETKP
jgi:hypothetical protein